MPAACPATDVDEDDLSLARLFEQPSVPPESPSEPVAPAAAADAAGGHRDGLDDANAEPLSQMLVTGVVKVLRKRAKAGSGPLPVDELGHEFEALWKVPFSPASVGLDAITFLSKFPDKLELCYDGARHLVRLRLAERSLAADRLHST